MAGKRVPKAVQEKITRFYESVERDGVPVSGIYLFGSFAKGNAHRWSDIDLCLLSTSFGNKIKDPMNYLWSKRVELRDYDIEPVGFSPKDFREGSPIISEIKKHGIRIK